MNKKHWIIAAAAVIGMLAFIFFPVRRADVRLRIYFTEDSEVPSCSVYYTTAEDPAFSVDKLIHGSQDGQSVDIVLPAQVCQNLSVLRLDLSPAETPICISKIEFRSAGFTRKSFRPEVFFAPDNLSLTNDILSVVTRSSDDSVLYVTYIETDGDDPYLLFSENIVSALRSTGSNYRITRLFLCFFVAAAIWLSHKKIFASCQEELV